MIAKDQNSNFSENLLPACLPQSVPSWFTAGKQQADQKIISDSMDMRVEKKDPIYRPDEKEHLIEKEREWQRTRKRMYVKRPVYNSNYYYK